MIPAALREKLLLNGCRAIRDQAFDPYPIVKIFAPNGYAMWLLTEIDPAAPDRAYGLCDLGLGSPELGYVSLPELASYRSRFGLPLERDRHFHARKPLSEYAQEAVSLAVSSPDVQTAPRPATGACRAHWRIETSNPDGRHIP